MDVQNVDLEKELTVSRFYRMCELYPKNTAVLYLGERFSYARLLDLSQRLAGSLLDMNVKKGDRVMIYLSNSIQWMLWFQSLPYIRLLRLNT